MAKKLKWFMINVFPFVMILLLLFIPQLKIDEINGSTENIDNKIIFGYHFITGYSVLNEANNYEQIITSKLLGLMPSLMMLSIFVISKVSANDIGKDIVNFLCGFVTLTYSALLPVFSITFLSELYMERLEFIKIWGYYIVLIFSALSCLYYLLYLINSIRNINKKNKKQEEEEDKKIHEYENKMQDINIKK